MSNDPQSAAETFRKDAGKSRKLVLASGSPRRRELLAGLGLEFIIMPSSVDEESELKDPVELVNFLSLAKAKDIAAKLAKQKENTEPTFVLGADTIVVLGAKILGKPASHDEAYEMLMQLSNNTHSVFTGVCLLDAASGDYESIYRESKVSFRRLNELEARFYADSEEPMDKAGAYALQGVAAAFVDKIDGSYSNIIGLPVSDTALLLRKHGISVMGTERI